MLSYNYKCPTTIVYDVVWNNWSGAWKNADLIQKFKTLTDFLFLPSQEHESEGGRTPLMKAARAGHLCTVQYLISRGAEVNRATSNNDHTVLSLACAGGHLPVVELLLAHGADPSHKLKVRMGGYSIWYLHTPCGRFTKSLPQGVWFWNGLTVEWLHFTVTSPLCNFLVKFAIRQQKKKKNGEKSSVYGQMDLPSRFA